MVLAQQGRKAFGSLVVGGKHHLPDCLVGIDRAQGRDAVEVGLALAVGGAQRRGDEGPKNVLHGRLRRLLLQPLQQRMALSVDGHHALLEQGLEQAQLVAEVVVDGARVHIGQRHDGAQRRARVAMPRKQLLGGLQKAFAGLGAGFLGRGVIGAGRHGCGS